MDSDKQEVIYSEDEAVFSYICDKLIELNSKRSQLKTLSYEEFDRFKHIKLTIKNPDRNEINDRIDSYISEQNKTYDYYLIEYDFKLVFNKNENSPHVKSGFFINKILISWKKFSKDVINDYNNKKYTFNRIDELNIITIADKMDMSNDFYFEHNMLAIEWKLNSMINKDKTIKKIYIVKGDTPQLENILISHLIINKCM